MMNEDTRKSLVTFFEGYPTKKYKRGEIILKPGDKPNYVGFLKSGYVRVYTLNETGQEISMSFFKPILYFTSIYATTGKSNQFYFEAVSTVEMWTAPKKDFVDYCQNNSKVGKEIMVAIADLFLNLVGYVGRLLSSDSLTKVALIIASVTDNKAHFPLTHKMIASLTGLTRETVTLQMLKLEKDGLIDNKNRKITILDRAGLDKLISK